MQEEFLRPGPIVLLIFLALLAPVIRGIRSGQHRMAWAFLIISTPVLSVCAYVQIHRALTLSHFPRATYALCAESTGRHRIQVLPPSGGGYPWVDVQVSSEYSLSSIVVESANFRISGVAPKREETPEPFCLRTGLDPTAPLVVEYEVTEDLQKTLSSCRISVTGPSWKFWGPHRVKKRNFAWVTGGLLAIFALMGVGFQVQVICRSGKKNVEPKQA